MKLNSGTLREKHVEGTSEYFGQYENLFEDGGLGGNIEKRWCRDYRLKQRAEADRQLGSIPANTTQ